MFFIVSKKCNRLVGEEEVNEDFSLQHFMSKMEKFGSL